MRYKEKEYTCRMEIAVDLVGGKWKIPILWQLHDKGILRFNALRRIYPDATQKMMTQQLRALEDDGLIARKVYAQVPPKTEYSLTELGRSLVPILTAVEDWVRSNIPVEGSCCPDRTSGAR